MGTKKDNQKVRIIVKAFDHRVLDNSIRKIVSVCKDSWAGIAGPVPLPTKIEKITVNRSTFVNKDAREQFEIRRHKRIIDIINPSEKTMSALNDIVVPSGIAIEIKAGISVKK